MRPEELIDVEMPDGTVISGVPSTITKREVSARYHRYQDKGVLEQQQKAYPTSAEQGGKPGEAVQSSFNMPEIAKGVGQSIANTGLAALQWGQNIVGAPVTPTPPSFQPKNIGQQVGNTAGYIGTSAIPAALTAGASLPTQVAAGGLGMGLAAAGANQDPTTASTIGMAMPVASQVLSAVGKAIPRKMAQAANDWMGVHPKWMEHGANPGQRLVDEGIVGGTREEVKQQIDDRLVETGRELQAKLLRGQGKRIDAEPMVQTALFNATRRIGLSSDPAFQARLNVVLEDILQRAPNLNQLSPAQANALKTEIGKSIKWTGTPYEGDINKALLEIYGGLNGAVKSNVPGVAPTLSRYSDFKVAQDALEESILKEQAGPGLTRGLGSAMTKNVVAPAAKVAGSAGLLGTAGYGIKRLLGY